MAQSVDGIVLEYYLGLLDGAVVANEIKQVRPQLPIVMLADPLGLPDGALSSVDALVAKSDAPHILLVNHPLRTASKAGRATGQSLWRTVDDDSRR
jgi:hypothetical protein